MGFDVGDDRLFGSFAAAVETVTAEILSSAPSHPTTRQLVDIAAINRMLDVDGQAETGLPLTERIVEELRARGVSESIIGHYERIAAATSLLVGSSAAEILQGTNRSDIVLGSVGNDTVRGDHGSDRYYYDLGDGADILYDHGYTSGYEQDRLILGAGISPANITLTRPTSDLDDAKLSFAGGGSVLLDEQFDVDNEDVEFIEFADGTVWVEADLRARLLTGTSGNDTIYGFNTSDTIRGGLGNDTLRGDNGSDRYYYDLGDGADLIYDKGYTSQYEQDRVILGAGIAPTGVTLTRSTSDTDDVKLSFAGGGSITLDEQFDVDNEGVEFIDFADGTVWTEADLLA